MAWPSVLQACGVWPSGSKTTVFLSVLLFLGAGVMVVPAATATHLTFESCYAISVGNEADCTATVTCAPGGPRCVFSYRLNAGANIGIVIASGAQGTDCIGLGTCTDVSESIELGPGENMVIGCHARDLGPGSVFVQCVED